MTELIDRLNLPWKDKPRRGGLLRAIGVLGDRITGDIHRVARSFHSFTAEPRLLRKQGEFLGLLPLKEEESAYRKRVSTAWNHLARRGQRGYVTEVLDNLLGGRYALTETPRMSFQVGSSQIGEAAVLQGFYFVVKVKGLTPWEKEELLFLLGEILDPDIQVIVMPWVPVYPKNLTYQEGLLYGGSRWLEGLFRDIGPGVRVKLLPEDAFQVGRARVGRALVYPGAEKEMVWIHCPGSLKSEVRKRAEKIFDASLRLEVKDE